MANSTASDIVVKMLQKSGVVTLNEAPSANEVSDGLDALINLLDSWSNDPLLVPTLVFESFTLTGASEYTIGTGQTFNTTRPNQIVSAQIRSSGQDSQLEIRSDVYYANDAPFKGYAGFPFMLSYNGASPVGTIRLYPPPQAGYELKIQSEKPIAELELDTVIVLPPGYKRAIIYNGAVEIASDYGQDVPPQVATIASTSLNSIRMGKARNQPMDSYAPFLPGQFNFNAGNF